MSFFRYDYRCVACDATADLFVRKDEKDTQTCNFCGETMKRLMAGPITTFKFHDRSNIKSKKAVSLRDKGSPPRSQV